MKQTILILSFILKGIIGLGQQHLEPAEDFSQYEGDLGTYYDQVFKLLYKGFSDKPIARYTSMPSFSSEYAFSIETIDGKHYIVSNQLSENYWNAKYRMSVKLITTKTELTNDLYVKLTGLFKLLEEQTKEPEVLVIGSDGVTYYFATTDKTGQVKIGETWSPTDTSALGKLVTICDSVHALGKTKDVSQADIAKKIDALITDLKK